MKWYALGAAGFLGYALLENNCILRVARYSLRHPDYHGQPRRLLLVSDLHCSKTTGQAHWLAKQARALQPDYILLAGDMVSRDCREFAPIAGVFRALASAAPTYYSLGNHELDLPRREQTMLRTAVRQSGVVLLDNETAAPEPTLHICGASLKRRIYRDEKGGFRHLAQYTAAELTAAVGTHDGFTVLLAHNPFFLHSYAAWGAGLVVSGHVHGGAVRLPGLGGVLSPERVFFPPYSRGLYQENRTTMLVSGGLGKLRLFNAPQICLLELLPQTTPQP